MTQTSTRRTPHVVLHISHHPHTFVRSTDCYRSAQIIARLLDERFPGQSFAVQAGFAWDNGLATGAFRDAAHSTEIGSIVAAELDAEQADNPDRAPKWIAFRFSDPMQKHPHLQSAYLDLHCAYLEHDVEVIARCRRDPHLVRETPIFTADNPDAETIRSAT